MKRIDVIGIDPQNDFIEGGSLQVAGGTQNLKNAANFINRARKKIKNIKISLDSHQTNQIFHPTWFLDKNNRNPLPFTVISIDDIKNGTWRAAKESLKSWTLEYVEKLEVSKKYELRIWPFHCLLWTSGWLVQDDVGKALSNWELDNFKKVDFIIKGNNPYVEHYSALEAEVVRDDDNNTHLNVDVINSIAEADEHVWFGLAGSHCLKFSFLSAINSFSDDSFLKRAVILTDCTSPVQGYEKEQEDWLKDMESKGVRLTTSVDYLA